MIVVHLDLDLASSFAARVVPFLLFDVSAPMVNDDDVDIGADVDADAPATNPGSGGGVGDVADVVDAVEPVDLVDTDDSDESDDVVVKPGRMATETVSAKGPGVFFVPLLAETGIFGLEGGFWVASCV